MGTSNVCAAKTLSLFEGKIMRVLLKRHDIRDMASRRAEGLARAYAAAAKEDPALVGDWESTLGDGL